MTLLSAYREDLHELVAALDLPVRRLLERCERHPKEPGVREVALDVCDQRVDVSDVLPR